MSVFTQPSWGDRSGFCHVSSNQWRNSGQPCGINMRPLTKYCKAMSPTKKRTKKIGDLYLIKCSFFTPSGIRDVSHLSVPRHHSAKRHPTFLLTMWNLWLQMFSGQYQVWFPGMCHLLHCLYNLYFIKFNTLWTRKYSILI